MKLEIKRDLSRSWLGKIFASTMAFRLGFKTYEPTPHLKTVDRLNTKRSAASLTRWRLMKQSIKDLEPESIVDLGCSEGFFVLKTAEETGAFSLGVDADVNRLFYASHQQIFGPNLKNVGFLRAELDLEFLDKLPVHDITIFLSVMHHVLYEHGYDYGIEMMKKIRKKTNKALYFETGNSNETAMKWAAKLPDMGPDVDEWVENFLKESGFKNVELLGKTPSYKKDAERGLFIAKP